jgi:hypothetical protein
MARRQTTIEDGNRPMTAAQAATLKKLAQDAYELDAFKPNLTRLRPERRAVERQPRAAGRDQKPITGTRRPGEPPNQRVDGGS